MRSAPKNWRQFWELPSSIWVCDRHRSLHGRLVADGIIDFIQSPFAIVLDYGCGEALSADRVAARCGKLILCDAAASVRSVLLKRYTGHGNVKVIAPEDVQAIPAESLDLIVANSVVQYISTTEVESLLDLLHPRLRNSGTLVIGDVIPPDQSSLANSLSLLRFAFDGGFFTAAMLGLTKLLFSDYRRLRTEVGLSVYECSGMVTLLKSKGFRGERHERNIGHNQARLTIRAVKAQHLT